MSINYIIHFLGYILSTLLYICFVRYMEHKIHVLISNNYEEIDD